MDPVAAYGDLAVAHKILAGTVFGLFVNVASAHIWSEDRYPSVDGNPMWAWMSSGLYQLILMPPCLFMAIAEKTNPGGPGGMWEYLHCAWDNAGDGTCGTMYWEEILACILLTYFIRDTVVLLRNPSENLLFLLHHLGTTVFCYLVLTMTRDEGVTASLIGSTAMEFGSWMMQIHKLKKSCPTRLAIFYWGMTASNVFAAVMIPLAVWRSYGDGLIELFAPRTFFIVILDVVIAAVRQLCLEGDVKAFHAERLEKKDDGGDACEPAEAAARHNRA